MDGPKYRGPKSPAIHSPDGASATEWRQDKATGVSPWLSSNQRSAVPNGRKACVPRGSYRPFSSNGLRRPSYGGLYGGPSICRSTVLPSPATAVQEFWNGSHNLASARRSPDDSRDAAEWSDLRPRNKAAQGKPSATERLCQGVPKGSHLKLLLPAHRPPRASDPEQSQPGL